MTAIMADMDAIGKNQKNQQQGFMYRGIDQVYNALHPVMAKHKVFTTPEVLDKTREERTNKNGTVLAFVSLRVKYTFWASDGSSVFCIVEGEGMDSGDKATNKAMAVAHKYAMLQAFCIPTEDMIDPDSQSHEVAPRQQPAQRRQVKQESLQPYPEERFNEMLPKWKDNIDAGKSNAAGIIAMVSSKFTLSDEQKKAITDLQKGEAA
jgi:hypothetical protein